MRPSWKDQQNAKVKNPAKPDGECLERVDAVLQNWKKRLSNQGWGGKQRGKAPSQEVWDAD